METVQQRAKFTNELQIKKKKTLTQRKSEKQENLLTEEDEAAQSVTDFHI